MQLKKINQDHYVVVTDEPIKEGDWIYWNKKLVLAIGTSYNNDTKKVTHSTSNVGGFSSLLEAGIKEIDLSYIKSLVGEVDVVELSKNATKGRVFANGVHEEVVAQMFYRKGYNQCVEDYTKEIHEVLDHLCDKMEIITQEMIDKDPFQLGRYRTFKYVFDYLKSISQPKDTWECEFIDGQLKLK